MRDALLYRRKVLRVISIIATFHHLSAHIAPESEAAPTVDCPKKLPSFFRKGNRGMWLLGDLSRACKLTLNNP